MALKPIKKETQTIIYKKACFFVLVMIVLLGLTASIKQIPLVVNIPKDTPFVSAAPQKVKITNVFPRGFTVTWVTTEKTSGAVVYGQDKQAIENKEGGEKGLLKKTDERINLSGFFTHSVKIDNLQPESKYYFKITSGEKDFFRSVSDSWQEPGVAGEVSLPKDSLFSPSYFVSSYNSPGSYSKEPMAFSACQIEQNREISSCFRPNPVYGQVLDKNEEPVSEALVFLEIPGKSNLLSSLTNTNGKWVFDLANLLKSDLSEPLGYDPDSDLIKITVVSKADQSTSNYFPIPYVAGNFKSFNNLIKLKTERDF